MGNSPSLRWGNQVRIDLHARVQADVSLQEESDAASDRLGWGNRRIGVDGVLFKRVEFQIEREFSDVEPWRDVFADVRMHRALRVRAGHFKVPFSMERTTSDFDLDFIARAASVTDISPGRETGIMLHGRGPRRFFEHEVGVFRLAEPPLKLLVESGTDGAMLTAARFTLRPAPRASESRSQEPSSREPSWLIRPLRRRWPAVLRGLLCQRPPTAAGRGPMDSREALDQRRTSPPG